MIAHRTFFLYAVMFAAFLCVASSAVVAQQPRFKAGDRVEVDENRSSERLAPKWLKARVIEVMMWNGQVSGIHVKTDSGIDMTVREKDLRPVSNETPARVGNVPAITKDQAVGVTKPAWKPIVDENNTVLADRELINCNFQQPTTSPQARPPVELLKKLIRCSIERPAPKGQDGAVTMDITKFVVGAPRRWRPGSDFGSGNASTIVYPIEVSYKLTKFYRSGNTVNENIWIYGCWVNSFRKWDCGTNERVKVGETKNIP
jgi:hypothetical protein